MAGKQLAKPNKRRLPLRAWLLYLAVAKGIASSDSLQILHIVPFTDIWYIVALVFLAAGILVGVGGSLTAIRRFLRV